MTTTITSTGDIDLRVQGSKSPAKFHVSCPNGHERVLVLNLPDNFSTIVAGEAITFHEGDGDKLCPDCGEPVQAASGTYVRRGDEYVRVGDATG